MSALVTPVGVIGAIYLREYARQGALVQAVRICVNNLAGVPSIVFGAVSYTHLDVYKRQTWDTPGPDLEPLNLSSMMA